MKRPQVTDLSDGEKNSPVVAYSAGMKTLFILMLVSGIVRLHAADFHVSPAGSGTKDGSRETDAAPAAEASRIFNERMSGGDRLRLADGIYKDLHLSLERGGDPGNPKILVGSKGAILESKWSIAKPDKGPTAISLGTGVSHLIIEGITVRNYCFAVKANVSSEVARSGIRLEGLRMEQVRHGLYLSDCDDLTVSGCDVRRYSKHGFRFDQGCDRVTLENCTADCSEGDAEWETKTELFTFGFIVNSSGVSNNGFTFVNCTASNNMKSNQGKTKYTNGDGFVVEGNATDVTFTRCRAFRNQDGGFDLKVKDVKLVDCVSVGHRRDFRIWNSGTMENCFAGWSQSGLWIKGGTVTAKGCTFAGHDQSDFEIEDGSNGRIALSKCILSTKNIPEGVVAPDAVTAGGDEFTKVGTGWPGGKELDSRSHPAFGYHSARLK